MLIFTVNQLIAHGLGDYVFQSDWMATNKTKKSIVTLCHVLMYSVPFIFLTNLSILALLFVIATHFVIDRWRLARFVVFAKNYLLAPDWAAPSNWKDCAATGYPSSVPPWMAVWLLIIVDNLMHIICNAVAIQYLG